MQRIARWLWMSDVLERTPRLRLHIWFFRTFVIIELLFATNTVLFHRDAIFVAMICLLLPMLSAMVHTVEAAMRFFKRDR